MIAYLESSSVLTQTKCKLFIFYHTLVVHCFIDRLSYVLIMRFHESKYAISLLGIEILGLLLDTAKSILKSILPTMVEVPEVDQVLGEESGVRRTFSVGLGPGTAFL